MLLNFSDGFKFILGWLVGKFVFSCALAFVDGILCETWPYYRELKDERDQKDIYGGIQPTKIKGFRARLQGLFPFVKNSTRVTKTCDIMIRGSSE